MIERGGRRGAMAVLLALLLVATACGDDGEDGEATVADGTASTSPTSDRATGTTAASDTTVAVVEPTTAPPTPTAAPTTTAGAAVPSPPAAPSSTPVPTPSTTTPIPPNHLALVGTVCTRPDPAAPCAPGGSFRLWGGDFAVVTAGPDGRFRHDVRLNTIAEPSTEIWAAAPSQTCTVTPPGAFTANESDAGTVVERTVECTTGPLATIRGTACYRPSSMDGSQLPCEPMGFFGVVRLAPSSTDRLERWAILDETFAFDPTAGGQAADGSWWVNVLPGRYQVTGMTAAVLCDPSPAEPIEIAAGQTAEITVTCRGR